MTGAPLPARRPDRVYMANRRPRAPAPPRHRKGPFRLGLWLPLTPLWVLLAPFALVFAPFILLAPDMRGVNPYRAAWSIGGVLLAMSGTRVSVESPDAKIHIRIL